MILPEKIKVGHLIVDLIEMDQKEADSIGADIYAKDALEAVAKVKNLLAKDG